MGENKSSPLKQIGIYAAFGMAITYPAIGGLVAGYFLDRWLSTEPWLTLALLVSGFIAGIVNALRLVKRIERKSEGEKS